MWPEGRPQCEVHNHQLIGNHPSASGMTQVETADQTELRKWCVLYNCGSPETLGCLQKAEMLPKEMQEGTVAVP